MPRKEVYAGARAAAGRDTAGGPTRCAAHREELRSRRSSSLSPADWWRIIRLKRPRRFQTTSSLDRCRTIGARLRRRSAPSTMTRRNGVGAAASGRCAPGRRGADRRATARRDAAPLARPLPSDLVRDALVWSPSTVQGVGPAVLESASLRPGIKGKAFYFDDTNRGFLAQDVGLFERTQPFSLDLWILAAQVYDDSMVLNHRENDNSGNAGYQLDLEKNRLRFDLMHSRAGKSDSRADQTADCGQDVDPRHGHLRRLEPRLRCGAICERCRLPKWMSSATTSTGRSSPMAAGRWATSTWV